jgi:hypothetical protein
MRLVGWNVTPVVMLDDGENLTPVNVPAAFVPAREWDGFSAGGWQEHLAGLAKQLEADE